jgi:CheY-like chemotaxis protein
VELPPAVGDAFDAYLDEWGAVADERDPFVWAADVDVDQARHLVVYFFGLLSIDDEVWQEHGLPFDRPESEPFYAAMANSVIDALAAADAEVGPSLKASWPEETSRPPRPSPETPLRVVVVDDTDDVRLLLGMALTIDGRFEVVGEAANGLAAIEVCTRTQPGGVLLDLMMPVMDGITALPTLRERCPAARIVVLSANDNPALVDQSLALGADAFVVKTSAVDDALEALIAAGDG